MIRVALIDGALADTAPGLAAQAWFCEADGGEAAGRHAEALAATLRSGNGDLQLINAVVFPGRLATSVKAIGDALDWLLRNPPEIVLCAFGLARASTELTLKTKALQRGGSLIVASAPARGQPVYPAALDGVISVQGDARCAPGELSRLDLPQAAFGACPVARGHPEVRGASAAAAHMAGILAANWRGSPAASPESLAETLAPALRYHGREKRSA